MADGARDRIEITLESRIAAVSAADWDALANPPGARRDPFVSHAFLSALEDSRCVGEDTGWAPQIGIDLRVVIFGFEQNARYPDAPPVPLLLPPVAPPPPQAMGKA